MGAIIQNGNIGAIIQNGIVYGGTIIESGADVSFNEDGVVYYRVKEGYEQSGDYIQLSTDGETWTDFYYTAVYTETTYSFLTIQYLSPHYVFRLRNGVEGTDYCYSAFDDNYYGADKCDDYIVKHAYSQIPNSRIIKYTKNIAPTPPTPSGADGLSYDIEIDGNWDMTVTEYNNGVQSNQETFDIDTVISTPATFGDLIITGTSSDDQYIVKPNSADGKSIKYNDVIYSGDTIIIQQPAYSTDTITGLLGWIV